MLTGKDLSAEALVRNAGAFGGDLIRGCVGEIAKRLPVDGGVGGEEPVEGSPGVHGMILPASSSTKRGEAPCVQVMSELAVTRPEGHLQS